MFHCDRNGVNALHAYLFVYVGFTNCTIKCIHYYVLTLTLVTVLIVVKGIPEELLQPAAAPAQAPSQPATTESQQPSSRG